MPAGFTCLRNTLRRSHALGRLLHTALHGYWMVLRGQDGPVCRPLEPLCTGAGRCRKRLLYGPLRSGQRAPSTKISRNFLAQIRSRAVFRLLCSSYRRIDRIGIQMAGKKLVLDVCDSSSHRMVSRNGYTQNVPTTLGTASDPMLSLIHISEPTDS